MKKIDSKDDMDVLNSIYELLQPLPKEKRRRLIQILATLLDVSASPSGLFEERENVEPKQKIPFSQNLSIGPKQFLLDKQPRTDVERIACLAYYLTHYREMPFFKTIDLSKLNTEAAQPKLSNPTYTTANALQYGYLAAAIRGQRQLSAAGEQFVNALPDRAAAKAVMASMKKRRRARNIRKLRPPK